MSAVTFVVRSVVALCLGGLSALAGFGVLLGLAWLPEFGEGVGYRSATLLLVTGISFSVGGYVAASITGRKGRYIGLLLGLLLGCVSCGYVLGPHWLLLPAVALSCLLGAIGGRLAERQERTAQQH